VSLIIATGFELKRLFIKLVTTW